MKNPGQTLVLIVDDDESVRTLLRRQMEQDGYRVFEAADGETALRAAKHALPDVVLLDALMPGMDGFEAARKLKSAPSTRVIPVIMITSLSDHESRLRALESGAQEFLTKPIDRNEVSLRVRNMLMLGEYARYLADQNRILGEMVESRSRQVLAGYRDTIEALVRAAAYKDEITGMHVRRIARYTEELAGALGMERSFCETIHYASQMHDVGKVGIPDSVLMKAGPLTPEEWGIMKTHTVLGAQLIGTGDSPYLRMGAEIALSHHERWDGTGYPEGLRADRIPLPARIMKICDQYDALRSERPYKPPLSHADSMHVLTLGDGRTSPSHFDPAVLAAFGPCAEKFREIYESLR